MPYTTQNCNDFLTEPPLVKSSIELMKAVFINCNWIRLNSITYTAPNVEKKHYNAHESDDFWRILNTALKSFRQLNEKEKISFVQMANSENLDFLSDFALKLEQCIDNLYELEDYSAPYHMAIHFGSTGDWVGAPMGFIAEFGFIDMLNLIKNVSASMLEAGLAIDIQQINAIQRAKIRLLEKHADAISYIETNSQKKI